MRNRTGGREEPGPASTGDPRWLSLYGRLDTSLVKATGSLGSWGLHSEHLEINTGTELRNCTLPQSCDCFSAGRRRRAEQYGGEKETEVSAW